LYDGKHLEDIENLYTELTSFLLTDTSFAIKQHVEEKQVNLTSLAKVDKNLFFEKKTAHAGFLKKKLILGFCSFFKKNTKTPF